MKRVFVVFPMLALLVTSLMAGPLFAAEEKKDPLANWATKFDYSKAEYTYILSNISHPVIEGVANGYNIRDSLWEKSKGRIYVDYRPLAQLGGEKDVIAKLKIGAVQGMLSSSVASANIADKLGIVNLPYVVDTYDKLDQFRSDPTLWGPYSNSAQSAGLMVADIVNYGQYGWATTTPVRNLADAKTVNFRIAEAPVNIDVYNAWGLKFTVMPWPDVPQALQTGVINGLDHTAIVCNITKKFTIAKYFSELNYAQGLFVHLVNKNWFNKLPADLQKIFIEVIEEESAKTRALTREQHADQIAKAKEAGVEFITMSDADKAELIKEAKPVYDSWGAKIGVDYLNIVRSTLK
ncbi:MAG: TRAP transporter substrate-binding protein [Desulfuromonadales bacterium]